jgi:hypothetical protein
MVYFHCRRCLLLLLLMVVVVVVPLLMAPGSRHLALAAAHRHIHCVGHYITRT